MRCDSLKPSSLSKCVSLKMQQLVAQSLSQVNFTIGVTKAVTIHFALHYCVDKWLCDFILLMNTSSLSVEYSAKNKLTSTSKGFDTQKLMTEFITNEVW